MLKYAGRAMYNIYENKPGIRKLHAAFQWILGNSYLMTNLLVGRFSRDLMRKHEMVHRLKQYRNPNAFTEHQFNVIPASACEAVAIYFAERTDTRIRDVLGTRVCSIAAGAISLTQPYKPIFTGNFVTPCLHGGVTAALLEHCAQSCVLTLPTCHAVKVKTENIRIDYLGPAPCFTATLAEAKVVSECDNYVRVDLICWNHDKSVKIALGMVELSRIYAS